MATRLRPDTPAKDHYDQDFYAWAEAQATLLRARRFEALDLDNLILEVADLGDAKRSAALSNVAVVIEHLLKLAHSPATEPCNGWRATVREHRRRLRIDLTPRLRQILEDQLADLHAMAAADAAAGLRDHGEDGAAAATLATPHLRAGQHRLVAVIPSMRRPQDSSPPRSIVQCVPITPEHETAPGQLTPGSDERHRRRAGSAGCDPCGHAGDSRADLAGLARQHESVVGEPHEVLTGPPCGAPRPVVGPDREAPDLTRDGAIPVTVPTARGLAGG